VEGNISMPRAIAVAAPRPRRPRWLRQAPVVPLTILVTFVLMGLLAPVLAPYSPTAVDLAQSYRPPIFAGGTVDHLLGTDKLGRDLLSRMMYGARVSLLVAGASIGVAAVIGSALGMLAGFRRGWVETVVLRLVDVNLALPEILIALLFAVVWGPSLRNLLIVITLTLWAFYARQTHAEAIGLREREFVLGARTIGVSDSGILRHYIFPNMVNSLIVLATLQIATIVLMESALSFLGVGVPPPTPSWGGMISEGRSVLKSAWWVSALPGVALALVIVAANLVGDWLRDYLDPTFRARK
jgi:peptide/nickel transport system permease protein